jgi:cobalt/nickel transport system permease protein
MHMADALLSPAVGIAFWAASGTALAISSRKVRSDSREYLVPLMGVLGAFVFAAMMINFTIPGTGSSGHIGGGLLLSILLGPYAAFVVIASVLTVQALFFADGGLLALGANIFNLGVFPCFIGLPLIYRPLLKHAGTVATKRRVAVITVLATVISLQLGALGVVTQTQLSGISSLPLNAFLLLMQPIHLAIGLIEGLATAALIHFVREARPDLFVDFGGAGVASSPSKFPTKLIAGLGVLALVTAGVFSWFASSQPDGLEWSIARATGRSELDAPESSVHTRIADLQKSLALFPEYKFSFDAKDAVQDPTKQKEGASMAPEAWPAVDVGTSLAGVIGGLATLSLVTLVAYLLRRRKNVAVSVGTGD